MNAKLFLSAGLLAVTLSTPAAESSDIDTSVSYAPEASTRWRTDPAYWDQFITMHNEPPRYELGKSGFNVGGPIVDGLRFHHYPAGRSLGQKILDLPIVRLFVPGPMPTPPEGSGPGYFAWRGQRTGRAYPASGSGNYVDHEPTGVLISVGH
jgi:hypothetical protein